MQICVGGALSALERPASQYSTVLTRLLLKFVVKHVNVAQGFLSAAKRKFKKTERKVSKLVTAVMIMLRGLSHV